MKTISILICMWMSSFACYAQKLAVAPKAAVVDTKIYQSVVKVEVSNQEADYKNPWNTGRFNGGVGTSFLIGKNRFLTNAHVVSNARRVLLSIYGSPRKYPAKVEFIAHDCDLALLSVEDFRDFEGLPIFALGKEVPSLESQVRVLGYPIGGDRLSVTRGVVSRVDYGAYAHTMSDSHLLVQIDAAINPGNSGGPVVQDNQVVGVAFQGLDRANSTGYMIPIPVIDRFLKDVGDGRYDSYPEFGVQIFPLQNDAMRKGLGIADDDRGVLVSQVFPQGSAENVLQRGDILYGIDGFDVNSEGMITIDGADVNLQEIVERKFVGERVRVQYSRAGKMGEAEIVLKSFAPSKIYQIQYEKLPRYQVFAGLVFQPMDVNLLRQVKIRDIDARRKFMDYVPKSLYVKQKDVVLLTRVLGDAATSQLDGFSGSVVSKVNGQEVTGFDKLRELLHPQQVPEFFVIEVMGGSRPIVIPSSEVARVNERVREKYGISGLENLNSERK